MCSPLACPVVQPAGPPFSVQRASLQKIHDFYLATWPSSPPALRLVLSAPPLFLSLHYSNIMFTQFNICYTWMLSPITYEYDLVKVLYC